MNNSPASAQAEVIPALSNWLGAVGSTASLVNDRTMNQGLLLEVQRAVQDPTASNGGLALNDSDSTMVPACQVSTALSAIINSLTSSNVIDVEMGVSHASTSDYKVSVNGGAAFSIPFLDFFSLGIGGQASYFKDVITSQSNSVSVKMTWTGPTLVQYGPVNFNQATRKSWYWMDPIRLAIKNTGKDVSGFKFAPDPQINFGPSGPFGFTEGVAIANYPSVVITVKSSDFKSIEETFQQSVSTTLRFLGIPLASASESTYSHTTQVDAANSTITITLDPPPGMIAGSNLDAVGWVLGAIVDHPAASHT